MVLASRPVVSVRRLAARPVGAQSSTSIFLAWRIWRILVTIVVLPTPGPPVITVTLHDLLLPLVPAMFFWQYKLGMWAMYHRVPQRPGFRKVALSDFMEWTTFLTVGRPILVGSLFFAIPAGLLVYFGLRGVLIRARAKAMPG